MAHHPAAFSSKFELVVPANRRPPPSALRLVSGPLPARNQPKHSLPSLPRPAFYPKAHVTFEGPKPRRRVSSGFGIDALPLVEEPTPPTQYSIPPLVIPGSMFAERGGDSGNSSPTSEGSVHSRPPSPRTDRVIRGPWDHSSAIKVQIDVESLLAPPRPAAINVSLLR
ncbi:unnamed protein product [Somion occarium]|uniref:Uncharacterized protein n=1 Tax=Somion occarium TaxID=3059160 RepID=A0ABP1DBA5_9APHY